MKKLFFLLSLLVLMGMPLTAKAAGGVFEGPEKGTSYLGVRLGLSSVVGANVTYDYALARVWKGAFTIGGQFGYQWNYGLHTIDLKVRTTYRLSVVVPEWEVYAGVGLGGGAAIFSNFATFGYFTGSFILGTNYHFSKAISAGVEFNFGSWHQTWVNLGVQFKL